MPDLALIKAQLLGTPLLVLPEYGAAVITALSDRTGLVHADANDGQDFMASSERRGQGAAASGDGVAVISMVGSMSKRQMGGPSQSGLSYQGASAAFRSTFMDRDVKGVLVDYDTPGGQAVGTFEIAREIQALSRETGKPVWAHANSLAASAGYALAAVSDRIIGSFDARLGSIGVATMHVDQSQALATRGLVVTHIHAGANKVLGADTSPLSDEALASIQARVNDTYGLFVSHVSEARGISPESVRATEASVFSIDEAITLGLADGKADFSDTLAEFKAHLSDTKSATHFVNNKVTTTMTPEELAAKAAADKLTADAAAADAHKAGMEAGALAASARINEILGCAAAADRPKLAMALATTTTMDAATAATVLDAAAVEAPATMTAGEFAATTGQNEPVSVIGESEGDDVLDTAELSTTNELMSAATIVAGDRSKVKRT